jgi:metal transporter CNNM
MLLIHGHFDLLASATNEHGQQPHNGSCDPYEQNRTASPSARDGSNNGTTPSWDNQTIPHDLLVALQYSGIVILICLSALFSGLVLGLLSLEITELEILKKCGTEKERQYASAIIPMRKNSNLVLCALVIGNGVVNSGLQWLLDSVFNGLIGFLASTGSIIIFGEILPQAVCARHGLMIGAKTICITWLVIIITFPLAYPLSLILDMALGPEIVFFYDRERLQEYMRIVRNYNNFDAQEINIITGALKIKKVTVSQVMTKLKDVFMLPIDTIINYQTIVTILKRGFSRIPVYEKLRHNLIGLLMVKDLALVNPHVDVTLKSLIQFYKHPLILVDESHTLDIVFNHFREGKSHMAFVREHKKRDIIGIVTLEDIIEEVLQVEINDETDIVTDNREFRARPDAQIPNDLDALHVHLADAIARRRAKERALNKTNPGGSRSSSRSRKQAPSEHLNQPGHNIARSISKTR